MFSNDIAFLCGDVSEYESKKKMFGSHQYQKQYHNQIKLGLSNKNQLILASNMGPNHQRYVDFPLFCLSFWFWATCRPNGAAIINRNTMYTGRDCSRKIWDNSLWRWICSSVATMMLCLLFDAAVLGRIVLDRTAAKYEGGGGVHVYVVDGKIRGSVSHVGTVLWVRSFHLLVLLLDKQIRNFFRVFLQ